MTICESCKQEKEVVEIEGHLLCKDCPEDIIRCDDCNVFLGLNYDYLTDNLGRLTRPELFLPTRISSLIFCDRDCLINYLTNNKDIN